MATKRIHFSSQHPFEHTDLCEEHLEEYKVFVWVQDLVDENGREIFQ